MDGGRRCQRSDFVFTLSTVVPSLYPQTFRLITIHFSVSFVPRLSDSSPVSPARRPLASPLLSSVQFEEGSPREWAFPKVGCPQPPVTARGFPSRPVLDEVGGSWVGAGRTFDVHHGPGLDPSPRGVAVAEGPVTIQWLHTCRPLPSPLRARWAWGKGLWLRPGGGAPLPTRSGWPRLPLWPVRILKGLRWSLEEGSVAPPPPPHLPLFSDRSPEADF